MDDKERDEILYRLDERTELIQSDIADLKDKNTDQDARLRKTEEVTQENRKMMSAVLFGVGSTISAIIGKFAGLLHF